MASAFAAAAGAFLSTPPSRVATGVPLFFRRPPGGFYPRHPRGWRPSRTAPRAGSRWVSIHATLAGGDSSTVILGCYTSVCLSTPPSRVATAGPCQAHRRHPRFYPRHPRGWRPPRWAACRPPACFYPRHPRGWRPAAQTTGGTIQMFLSTPPSRVATHTTACYNQDTTRFYPRHPRGWRPSVEAHNVNVEFVSIHATLAGGDHKITLPVDIPQRFLSTPPSRVATIDYNRCYKKGNSFYPRHPRGWRRTPASRRVRERGVSIHATLAGGDELTTVPEQ